ncbi:hypothetical protein AWW67_07585 [Roseivirga seohaensis]|uniref:Peptidase A2 domain-containing protein n=1 Tax=Roseivirga seohaensis TaxID=1914963 RepID=A0A150XR82_9BACT|nr:hypothetical protein [Roseivirga seohaensis]KYG81211.1 hypothetical protein AWW67_07585 [Roseivirga seohaensis]
MKSESYKINRIGLNNLPKLMVPIKLTNPDNGKEFCTEALIDTGAEKSIFPSMTVRMTGRDFQKTKSNLVINNGLGGKKECYEHDFIVQIMSKGFKEVIWASGAILIDCCEDLKSTPLLGVKNILENLRIEINYPTGELSIHA